MRGRRALGAGVLMVGTLLSAAPAGACTLCHSRIAGEVRVAVFGPDFWSEAASLVSPVPLLAAAVIAIRRYLP